jgi:hypothetical protein
MARKRGSAAKSSTQPVPAGLLGVARTRDARVRTPYDTSIARDMDEALRELRKLQRAVGGAASAWSQVVPPELAERCRLIGVSRGTLEVRVPDAATRFALDRFLRSGGERAVIAASAPGLQRIRVTIGE